MNHTLTTALLLSATSFTTASTNLDPTTFAWAENIGWINFNTDPATGPVFQRNRLFFQGHVWSENAGWINFGNGNAPYENTNNTNFGVNVLPDGQLEGFAWAENFGWINFDTKDASRPADQWARYDIPNRRLRGYAWAENVGWINLDDQFAFPSFGPLCQGDFNNDGSLDIEDLIDFTRVSNEIASGAPYDPTYDVDLDGDVDIEDLVIFLRLFSQGGCQEL